MSMPGAVIIARKLAADEPLGGHEISGYLATAESLESVNFSVRRLADNRTAWLLYEDGLPAAATASDRGHFGGAKKSRRFAYLYLR